MKLNKKICIRKTFIGVLLKTILLKDKLEGRFEKNIGICWVLLYKYFSEENIHNITVKFKKCMCWGMIFLSLFLLFSFCLEILHSV